MALKHKATNHIFFKMAKKEKALLCDDEESNNTENEAQGFTKDSWRAFLVCFSLLLSRAFVNGVLHSWGFFLVAFVRDMKSSRERAGKYTIKFGINVVQFIDCGAEVHDDLK